MTLFMRIWELNNHLRRSRTATVLTVSLALFTDMCAYGIIVPILPDILLRMGRTKSDLGILVASYAIGLFVFTPIFGILSDKYNSRKVPMLFGLLGLGISTILFAFGTTFWQLFLARLAQGISGGASWSIGLSMIADVYPNESLGTVMGTVMGANVLGQLLGPAIGGALYQHISYEAPFYFCAMLAFADFIVRLWVIPPTRQIEEEQTIENEVVFDNNNNNNNNNNKRMSTSSSLKDETIIERETDAIIVKSTPVTNYSSIGRDVERNNPQEQAREDFTFWKMIFDSQLIVNNLGTIVIGNLYSALEPTLPLHFKNVFGSDETAIGLLFTSIVIPNIIMSPLAGFVSDKYGRKLVSGISMIILGLVAPLIALPSGSKGIFLEVVMLLILGSVTAFAITPIMPDMADVVVSRGGNAYGQVYALFNMAYSIGMITGPLIGIALYDLSFIIDLSVLAVLLIIVGIITLIFQNRLFYLRLSS